MNLCRSGWLAFTAVLLAACTAAAAEPVLEFVKGLRARSYFDTAEEYLEQVEDDPQVPDEIKQRIPYEKAITLVEGARELSSPDLVNRQLDRAQALLEQFIKANPGHPLTGAAQSQRGHILLGKARAEVIQAKSPAGANQREQLRQSALDNIARARQVFQSAHDEFQTAWEKFPKYIPPEEKQLLEQRQEAEKNYMQAQLDLAKTTYQQAQVYEKNEPQYAALLTKASREFEEIHRSYRSQVAGLLARMWQGKCFEEQDQIGRALGIYNELLGHNPGDPRLKGLQDQVRHFRLICWNHDQRRDYQLVVGDATEWLTANKRVTPTWLGVRYQRAVAYENLGMDRTRDRKEREHYLRQALIDAREVNRFPGQYKDVTTFMIQRVRRELGLAEKEPATFVEAFTFGRGEVKQIKPLQDALREARAAGEDRKEIEMLEAELKAHLDETARLLQLALKLAGPDEEFDQVNNCRYLLSYVYYLQDRVYESAVLGEYVGRTLREEDPEIASDAAYLALAAYIKAYNRAPSEDRETEMDWIVRAARRITASWPGTERAIDAVMKLGRIHEMRRESLQAAHWYSQVPESTPQYPEALLAGGQAFWQQYLLAAAVPAADRQALISELTRRTGDELLDALAQLAGLADEDRKKLTEDAAAERYRRALEKLSDEQLRRHFDGAMAAWRDKAERSLANGIQRLQEQLPDENPNRADLETLTAAKVTLAQILVNRGDYEETLTLLTGAPPEKQSSPGKTPAAKTQAKKETSKKRDDAKQGSAVAGDKQEGGESMIAFLREEQPHPVMDAVAVENEIERPARGVTSREFASLAYQLLLRAYVGLQDIDNAQKAMARLEAVAGNDAGSITGVYIELGRQLQEQIKRLRREPGSGEQLKEVLASFDSFLGELFKKKETMPYSQLMWIATTYYGLGEGVSEQQAPPYFEKAAATYREILERDQADDAFIDESRELAVKLRLINCRRRQQDFPGALQVAVEVLRNRPNILSGQIEAAYVFQDWGSSGQPEKFLAAINGPGSEKEGKGVIWGWAEIASRLHALLDLRDLDPVKREEYHSKFLLARYNISWCRTQYALTAYSDPRDPQRRQVLGNARAEIDSLALISANIDGKQFLDDKTQQQVDAKDRFNALYRRIQLAMGVPEDALASIRWPAPQPETPAPTPPPKKDNPVAAGRQAVQQRTPAEREQKAGGGPSWIAVVLVVLACLGAVGWFSWAMMNQPSRRRRTHVVADLSARRRDKSPAANAARKQAARTAGRRPPQSGPASGTGQATGTKRRKPRPEQ